MNKNKNYDQKIFSYGTLQLESVQLAMFQRPLSGQKDKLRSYRLSTLSITNPDVVATSGIAEHPVAVYTGNQDDYVDGMVLEVSQDELAIADHYEAADYQRIEVGLDSGLKSWLYVKK